jgi:hypothetical protein
VSFQSRTGADSVESGTRVTVEIPQPRIPDVAVNDEVQSHDQAR